MSLLEQLLRPLTAILRAWPLCTSWWSHFLTFYGWRPAQVTPENDEKNDNKPSGPPKVIRYVEVAGEWERTLHPDWPDSRFQIPDNVPYGTIYHVRKGRCIGFGATAYVEVTPEEHVVKTPRNNPYNLREEERNLADMRAEAMVYHRIGLGCPYVPKLITWDPDTCCLTIEYLKHNAIDNYMNPPGYDQKEPPEIEPALRRRWALQVTRGLQALHVNNIIHADLTPRNVLLGADMNVRIADFAGSSADGEPYKICAGERYVVPDWSFCKTPEPADDIFLLGGVIYFIMTGKEPHHGVESEFDVAELYKAGTFPDVTDVDGGAIIQGCWNRSFTTAAVVLEQLLLAFNSDDDPFMCAVSQK